MISILKMKQPHKLGFQVRLLAGLIVKLERYNLEKILRKNSASITPMQYGILNLLSSHPGVIAELSHKMCLGAPTLVPAVEGLVEKKYVKRNIDLNDRRRSPLEVTSKGRQLLASISWVGRSDFISNALKKLGPAKTGVLIKSLREIVKGMPKGTEILKEMDKYHMAFGGH